MLSIHQAAAIAKAWHEKNHKRAPRPCHMCGHRCYPMCPKCGGDPMLPGDKLCADCDADLRV